MELKQSQARSDKFASELKDANGKLRELVSRDGLTGLYNHRHFQEMLLKEVHEATRYKRSLTLILFDVDHFKNVNDSFGHPAGDAVLKGIARFVSDMVRASDIVARYGGEEFAVILPETRSREAVILAERMRRGIEAMEVGVGDEVINVTVSLGICTYLGEETSDPKGVLIESADQALYAAKRNGRNRLMVAR
jgi:diguanylate cyclase (GGDEF)-like protein